MFWSLAAVTAFMAGYGIWEFTSHQRNLAKIPIRIHVNGTRGKSSVTRLIGGGLRAGDLRVFLKTTGSAARFITPDGVEHPVIRFGKPNIKEQIGIIKRALDEKAEALVIECMAVQPELQWIDEVKIVHATTCVITNARADHLDVMGPTVHHVCDALCETIPRGGSVFTAEMAMLDRMRHWAAKENAKLVATREEEVPDEWMDGFSYIEHKENVALALAVCEEYGVPREKAIHGMWAIQPDVGALRAVRVVEGEKHLTFINAFAANDPDSTLLIWKRLDVGRDPQNPLIALLNMRQDRVDRSLQFGHMLAHDMDADFYLVSGQATHVVVNVALREGGDPARILDLGSRTAMQIFQKIIDLTPPGGHSTVIGVGNIVGFGSEIVAEFHRREVEHAD